MRALSRRRPSARPALAPLGAAYRKLWWASMAGNLGDGVRRVALPLLAVTLTRDPILVSLVAAAGSLPWLVVGLFAGALVDRWDRIRIMLVVNAARAGVMALLVVAMTSGWVSIWLLVLVALFIGTGEAFVSNAAQAVLPRLVPRESLDRANGRLYGGKVVTGQFLGQGLAGALFGIAVVLPFVLDAVMLAAASLIIMTLAATLPATTQPQAPAKRPRVVQDIGEGLRWLLDQPLLRSLWFMLAALGFASGAFWGIVALYSVEILNLAPSGYGIMLAVGATGSLVGSLIADAVRTRIGATRSLHLAVVLITAASAGLALTDNGYVAGAMMIGNGVGVLLWNVVGVSLRQRLTPEHLLGRVNAAYSIAGVGAMTLGSLAAGLVAHLLSLPAVFWLSAMVIAVAGIATASTIRASQPM